MDGTVEDGSPVDGTDKRTMKGHGGDWLVGCGLDWLQCTICTSDIFVWQKELAACFFFCF